MSPPDPDDLKSEIKAELGGLLISFNGATRHLVDIIITLVGAKQPIQFLTHHMNEGTLSQVVYALASNLPDGDDDDRLTKDRLIHGQTYFERVRIWRNHFAHHTVPLFVYSADLESAEITTVSVKAKDKIIVRSGTATANDIRLVGSHCRMVSNYLFRLRCYLDYRARNLERIPENMLPTLPEKPPLIDTFESTLK